MEGKVCDPETLEDVIGEIAEAANKLCDFGHRRTTIEICEILDQIEEDE